CRRGCAFEAHSSVGYSSTTVRCSGVGVNRRHQGSQPTIADENTMWTEQFRPLPTDEAEIGTPTAPRSQELFLLALPLFTARLIQSPLHEHRHDDVGVVRAAVGAEDALGGGAGGFEGDAAFAEGLEDV